MLRHESKLVSFVSKISKSVVRIELSSSILPLVDTNETMGIFIVELVSFKLWIISLPETLPEFEPRARGIASFGYFEGYCFL